MTTIGILLLQSKPDFGQRTGWGALIHTTYMYTSINIFVKRERERERKTKTNKNK